MLRASVGLAALLLSGCHLGGASGETQHETKAIELDSLEAARVDIRMNAGELQVTSGTSKLLEADFAYNVPDWKPEVNYRVGSSRGELTISQPQNATSLFGHTEYTWDLKLNREVPLDVNASMGAGKATFELGQMNLRNVVFKIGAGEVKMDLRGEPQRDYSVEIQGGVGQATVYLPKDPGISATATGGIGSISVSGLERREGVWINPERINAPVTVHLDVKGGIGEIRLIR